KTFRRHIVSLGTSGITFIYDELEADKPVTWSYLLHTVINPMTVDEANKDYVHIQATNKSGASDAYLFSSGKLTTETTDKFFFPAVNWLRADDKGHFKSYANHWHFTATSDKQQVYRFATIIDTHAQKHLAVVPQRLKDGHIQVANWIIDVNISTKGEPFFFIRSTNQNEKVTITYKGDGATIVEEDGNKTILNDTLPNLEI
ncbi:MAG: heparinase, partial [Bacteroides sp.]